MCATTGRSADNGAGGGVILLARPRRRASRAHLANYAGLFQADAYGGYNRLYEPVASRGRSRGGLLGACAPQVLRAGRRLRKAPIAIEAVRRIDALFDIERDINGRARARRGAAGAQRATGR